MYMYGNIKESDCVLEKKIGGFAEEMGTRWLFLLLEFLAAISSILGGDNLLPTQMLVDNQNQTLVSSNDMFELGFFTPTDSKKRYIGIWFHKIPDKRPVWVANNEQPLNSSSGTLQLSENGNLILSENGTIVWSTGTVNLPKPSVLLSSTGNLVVTSGSYDNIVWQSFDHMGDTFIAGMKLGNFSIPKPSFTQLASWRSPSDPSSGDYYWRLDFRGLPEAVILHNKTLIHRTGPWNGEGWSARPNMINSEIWNFYYHSDQNQVFFQFTNKNTSLPSRLVMNVSTNELQRYAWSENDNDWYSFWKVPDGLCDKYQYCGANCLCKDYFPYCDCLDGFHPKSQSNWNKNQYSDGCLRKDPLNCSTDNFKNIPNIKLPDTLNATVHENKTLDECRSWCITNCSCIAYTVINGAVCIIWFDDLEDMKQFAPDQVGADELYLRLAASYLSTDSPPSGGTSGKSSSGKNIVLIVIPSLLGFLFLISFGLFLWWIRRRAIRKGSLVPQYDMSTIKAATNDFSDQNKLGDGGFGVVYKGKLRDGQEIAVKRLLRVSWQGPKEFKNELELIANLQHRNLVRLLGCCIEGDERMLILEYMENKSLDAFIYDQERSSTFDWRRRKDIIMGIARGLQYLHEDSYLNVVHRDLKPSNILLDKEMNPRISDFGISRILSQRDALRVTDFLVGTIGYMAPEYCNTGTFSAKSDVFSFGVIVLEILTGKRNIMVNLGGTITNLIGYVHTQWEAGRALEALDEALTMSSQEKAEALHCIQIALLCVQESSEDRPTMSKVIVLLSNEAIKLEQPKYPNTGVANIPRHGDFTSTSELTASTVFAR